MIRQVSKREFRKAQCRGALDGCEALCGVNGTAWVRGGKWIASMCTGILGSTYYLESQQ